MAQTHLSDHARITGVSRNAAKKLRAFLESERERREQIAAIRAEGKDELAVLCAQGFDKQAMRQALAEMRRDDATEVEVREAREAYLAAMRGAS